MLSEKRVGREDEDGVIRLAVCSLTYPLPNGVTASINTAVDGLLNNNYKIKIIAPDYRTGKARPEHYTTPSSVVAQVVAKNIFGKEERMFRYSAAKKISLITDEFEPHIYWLHTVTYAPNIFEKHMLKEKKGKILFYHTLVEEYGRLYAGKIGESVMRRRTKELCNKMDAIMTPSEMMKERLLKNGVKTPVSVIPTGIDAPKKSFTKKELRDKYNLPDRTKILLYLGRMSKEKNLDALIRMMVDLKNKDYKAILLFVGPGDIADVQEEAVSRGIGDMVFCTGPVNRDDAQKIYGACDAFVFSSQTETQGLVVGEAMLANTPVVAMTSPIQKEVYPRSKAKVVSSEEKLADAVIKTFSEKEKTRKMVKEAREFVENNFSKEKMIQRQMVVFQEVFNKYKK